MENETKPRFNYTGYATQGKRYSNNLGIADIAKIIRKELKEKYPACTFSTTIQKYSGGQSLHLALMSAPFEVFNTEHKQDKNGNIYTDRDYGYAQLNKYQFKEYADGYNNGAYLTKEAYEVVRAAADLANSFNYDDSDAQIDYFHCNFYLNINIGKWDKPFAKIN